MKIIALDASSTQSGWSVFDDGKYIKSGYINLKKDVYTVLEGGEYLIQSLESLSIDMDKYKTSELGKALKRVFRGEMSVAESVRLAENEIADIFRRGGMSTAPANTDTGAFGQIVGKCPVCQRNVVRGKTSYGCMGYNDGCSFRVGISICKKSIPINEVARLLATGSTAKMHGFISKAGKAFDGKLVIKDGAAVFSFD